MIKFENNFQLDTAMKNLILSMIEVSEYLNEILNYTEKTLTPKMERELIKILQKYHVPHNNLKYDVKKLIDNPYYKNIKLDDVRTDTVWYEKALIKKRTLMSMNFHKPLGKYLFHYHPVGYFENDVYLPVLKEGEDKVWMSPAISEIESMNVGIQKGHGKCMTMGLGIGVLPYLWLNKEEVESVTIVEFNKDVIDLFEKYIRPQFPKNKKLEIIHGNGLDYYNEEFLNQFDYAYIDFWESNEDGLEYYTKLMEKKVYYENIDFWVEDSMLSDVKHIITPYLNTLYQGKSIAEYISSLEGLDQAIAKKANRYFKSRNHIIRTEEELLSIIHSRAILREILAQ
ncbi:hypothetical protein DES36_12627 [Alkalibaculum bacchi]|uniref:Spermine/spermidine synthase n=1 Tax=Alkalibaculum bacchi TaxID=645887 RepID=A0A366HZM1_9FIRM|nr:hypothetical protein [Alkalibaculum bacchi]RBP57955.1 hypothetical protein DES36_12627 [Alkalibaculum bacchi]